MGKFAAIILAGGASNRMKSHKAFLKFNDHLTFVEKIVKTYQDVGMEQIILVISPSSLHTDSEIILNSFSEEITIIYNYYPERGRMYSLILGLSQLTANDSCFIQNIDNPFVESRLLLKMQPVLKEASFVSPTFNGKGGHPVLLSPSICKFIVNMQDEAGTLKDILSKFKRISIPYNESVLVNINTPMDYKNYFY